MKVEAYGASLLAAWQSAAESQLAVDCGPGPEGRKIATHLRFRLYSLRKALKAEGHYLYHTAARVGLSVQESAGHWWVVGSTADAKYDELLKKAGVVVPDAPDLDPLSLETEEATEAGRKD